MGVNSSLMMQEHRQRQASMGQAPTHFGHMMNCLKFFEDGCTKRKSNSKGEAYLSIVIRP
jgi:hypothetical protein